MNSFIATGVISQFQDMISESENAGALEGAFSFIRKCIEEEDIDWKHYQELYDCLRITILQHSRDLAEDVSEETAQLIESACQEMLSFLKDLLPVDNQASLFR